MKRIFLIIPCLVLSVMLFGQQEKYSNISKYSDIYHAVLRELEINYVDTLKHDQLTESAIGRMLYSLDPYTTYYPESKEDEIRRLRSGEYGGIGSIISQRKDGVYINEPYEGMPSQKAGLLAGDKILEIDGSKTDSKTVAQVSEMLRGTPGTQIVIKVNRQGEKSPLTFKFDREVIQMPSISYAGVVSDSIGYIVINDFVDHTAADFKFALSDLVQKQKVSSLIIDLRENGGGLVDQVVEIASLFLPRNSPVVSMKGRMLPEEKVYKTTSEPLYPQLPIVVLINGSTASSSEILSGALQDYDRAVIMGERSYGKGLVQNIRRLPYNSYLKITTAKYYTPSGRCVQAIDYALRQNNERERIIPDSLTSEFTTANGRKVRDGGGITPDVKLTANDAVNIGYYLYTQNIFFDYASLFRQKHPMIADMYSFRISDAQYQEFVDYVLDQKFTYQLESEKYLQDLKEMVRMEGYDQYTDSLFIELSAALQPNVKADLQRSRTDIQQLLENEIIKRYYYQKGSIVAMLKYDKWIPKAIEILQQPTQYNIILSKQEDKK